MLTGIQPVSADVAFGARTHKTDALHYLRGQLGENVRVAQASKNQRADFLVSLPETAGLSTNEIQQKLTTALLGVSGVEATDREYLFVLKRDNKDYQIKLTGAPRQIERPDTHR